MLSRHRCANCGHSLSAHSPFSGRCFYHEDDPCECTEFTLSQPPAAPVTV